MVANCTCQILENKIWLIVLIHLRSQTYRRYLQNLNCIVYTIPACRPGGVILLLVNQKNDCFQALLNILMESEFFWLLLRSTTPWLHEQFSIPSPNFLRCLFFCSRKLT